MALNFTGRQLPPPEEPPRGAFLSSRTPVMAVACFGIAAMLAGLVFVAALRQHKADAPPPLPALVGIDAAAQTPPPPVAATPAPAVEPAWIEHKAAPTPAVAQAPSAPAPQAQPSPEDRARAEAAAKARMLAALRQVPHGVITLSVEDDPLAEAYAVKLRSLFREAGWTVDETSVFGSGPPRKGLAAAFGVSPAGEAVREAFDAVGFQFLPPPRDAITQTPEIFVGIPVSAAPARPSPAPGPERRP